MELTPPLIHVQAKDTHRLIPSRFPPIGILDTVASPSDLTAVLELEGWTNDRISSELGLITTLPPGEWVTGKPHATAIMAAYCHPNPMGGRFNDNARGAWYAGLSLDTAMRETTYHRSKEFEEIGVVDARVEMRQYLANFDCNFHDVRQSPDFDPFHDPDSYEHGQALAHTMLASGSNGLLYRSVRHPGHECIACFRPPLVENVRPGAHFEFLWSGTKTPTVTELVGP